MKYSTEQLNADIKKINETELEPIRIDRGKRYGGKDDTLENVAAFGWVGAVISAYECAQRLKNAVNSVVAGNPVPHEEIENASEDLINYAFYVKILHRRELKGEAK
jgi:hypothetical protein